MDDKITLELSEGEMTVLCGWLFVTTAHQPEDKIIEIIRRINIKA